MKIYIRTQAVISFVLMLTLMQTSAAEQNDAAATKVTEISAPTESQCDNQLVAKVNGLVCDFCARALEKVFSKKSEVASIKVDLDKGLVGINFNPNQSIAQDVLTQLITDSGYNVVEYQQGCDDEK